MNKTVSAVCALFAAALLLCLSLSGRALALGGYDSRNNTDVDLLCSGIPEEGQELELFDFRSGDYTDVFVESREDGAAGVTLVLSEPESGLTRRVDIAIDAAAGR